MTQNHPHTPENELDPLDASLRRLAGETHPQRAFVARLRGELEAAPPRRGRQAGRALWNGARRLAAQGALVGVLVGLVALALALATQLNLGAPAAERTPGSALLETATPFTTADGIPGAANLPLPEGALARLGLGQILSLDTAPDGRLAIGSSLGVSAYTSSLAAQWRQPLPDSGMPGEVRFDPGGERLAAAYPLESGGGKVVVLDAATGALLA